jgi:hypothetical protein
MGQLINAAVAYQLPHQLPHPSLGRMARAVELRDRALAASEAALPSDSLTLASLLNSAVAARLDVADDAGARWNEPAVRTKVYKIVKVVFKPITAPCCRAHLACTTHVRMAAACSFCVRR